MKPSITDKKVADYIYQHDRKNAFILHYLFTQSQTNPSKSVLFKDFQDNLTPNDVLALLHNTKASRPELSIDDVKSICRAFESFVHPPTVFSFLPQLLESTVYTWAIEEHEAEPLRREIEEATLDDEFQELLYQTPILQFANRLSELEPVEAFSVFVSHMFWQGRRNALLESYSDNSDFDFSYYFSISA